MNERISALFGVIGPLVALIVIVVSIVLSPWFSWQSNALSDLGHAVSSSVAPLFNFGLFVTGFFIIIYAIKALKNYAKYSSYCLLISAVALQLAGVFDEVYGILHLLIAILLFASMGFSSVIYTIEKRSVLALSALIIGLSSWILLWTGTYDAGIAVPETVSAIAVTLWIIPSAFQIYLGKTC